jgi:hypothetical protein
VTGSSLNALRDFAFDPDVGKHVIQLEKFLDVRGEKANFENAGGHFAKLYAGTSRMSGEPYSTAWAFATSNSFTTPARSAEISFMIFMASIMPIT